MALPELVANSPVPGTKTALTTLGAAITSTSATTLTSVAAAPAALQVAGQFHMVVDSEIMIVTAGANGTTWTVTRGAENSTAATHLIGAGIFHYFTAEALLNLMSQNVGGISSGTAFRTAGGTYGGGSLKILLDTVLDDAGGNWDVATNYRFNVPVTGRYHVSGQVSFASGIADGETILAFIYKNGSEVIRGDRITAGTGASLYCQVSGTVKCAAGDYLEMYLYTSAGAAVVETSSAGSMCRMSVDFMSPIGVAPLTPNTGARAYRNAALTMTAGAWAKVPIDTVATGNDPGGHMDVTTNHRYNVPSTGWYQVNGEINPTSTASGQQTAASIYKNGTQVTDGSSNWASGSGGLSTCVSDLIYCTAGDYLELWCFSSAALALGIGSVANYLSAVRVDQPSPAPALLPAPGTFSAYSTSGSAYATSLTKVPLGTVDFDLSSYFSSANSRFQPTLAGYYQINAGVNTQTSLADGSVIEIEIFKNGAAITSGAGHAIGQAGSGNYAYIDPSTSSLVYLNGTTDYVELFALAQTSAGASTGINVRGWMTGFMATSAVAQSGNTGLPGDLIPSGAATRLGCLLCDGTSYTTAALPALFAAIGYAYGGSGANFNVPDLRGRSALGAGTGTAHGATAHALGSTPTTGAGGEETHLLSAAESGTNGSGVVGDDTPDHAHLIEGAYLSANRATSGATSGPFNWVGGGAAFYLNPGTMGATTKHHHNLTARAADNEHNNLPPTTAVNWFIKT